ncbi:hypothetical protein HHI36_006494 [Cryptolaemus montrouzieri]|uniref:C2H2-type domain-containing protein n=1 Tax=Cryptolaemus montrouzieri TaxID=559131 RepID=A0ABD2NYB8_9CUCU
MYSEEENEVIRLFIVGEDGKEVEVNQNDLSFIKLEITNTEDENFGYEESDAPSTNEVNGDDSLLIDNIKIEVIEDPEAEFAAFYGAEIQEDDLHQREILEESENENEAPRGSKRTLYEKSFCKNNRQRKLHRCDICGYTSHQKSHYRRHLTIHFKPDGVRCSVCRKPMISKVELSDHMEEHRCPGNRNRFKCNICSYTSNKLTNVSQHTEVHYKPKKERLECDRCNFSTTNKLRLRNHSAIHMNMRRSTKCPVCLMVFKSMAMRRRHIQQYKSPDDPSKYQCPECSYNTTKFNNFKQHMVVHRSEFEIEMFQCAFCPFKSKRKTDLRQHVIVKHKTDEEVTLFQCDFCSYESRRGNHLTSHMKNRHRKELIVKKCGLCSYKSVSQVLIEKHFLIHSKIPERFFLCSICGFGCQSQILLDRHMTLKHTNEYGEIDDDPTDENFKLRKTRDITEPDTEPELCYSFELVKVKQEKADQPDQSEEVEMAVFCCQFPQCNFFSPIERDAKIHMTICHNKKGDDNRCPECTFHTTSRYFYLDHLKVHGIDIEHLKPHLCEICGTRWIRQGDLTRHMAVHWGGEAERRRRSVKVEEPSNKKLLHCAFCNYKTRIRLCLYKHMSKHERNQEINFNDYVKAIDGSEDSE